MCSMHPLPGTWNLFHAAHRTSSAHVAGDELVPGLTQTQSWAVLPGWSLVREHQSVRACFDVRHSIFQKNRLHFLLPVLPMTSAFQFSKCWGIHHNWSPLHSLETYGLKLAGSGMGDHGKTLSRNEGIKSKAPGKFFTVFSPLKRKMHVHRKEGPEGQTTVPSGVHNASNAGLTDERHTCPHPKKWHQQDGSKNMICKKNPSDFSLASSCKWHTKWLVPLICCHPSPKQRWVL